MSHSSQKQCPRGGFWGEQFPGFAVCVASLAFPVEPASAQASNPLLPRNLSPWGMFLNADIVVKGVMIGLACASFATWTVWLAKTIELRVAKRAARRRLKMLETGGGLADAVRACEAGRD